jgi:5-methylthioadenosine/S-adenosylhomocysteine deaminase
MTVRSKIEKPQTKQNVPPKEQAPLDILIRGATALTAELDRPVIEDAVIGIRGDRLVLIEKAGTTQAPKAHHIIDACGHLATPGFVNVHTHAVLSFARGMTEDMGFAPAYTPGVPHAPDVREDEAVALARLTALEAMLFGSTLMNDMYVHAHATLPAIAQVGIRISSSAWIHDVEFERVHERIWNHDAKIGERWLRYAVEHAQRWQGAFDGRASVMFAPHAIDTCSRGFLREVEQERRRMGLRVMTHLAQSRLEVEQVKRRDGMTPAEVVDDVEMLHEHLIAAHCIFMTPSDIARAGRAGITVAHAPKVNLTGGCLPVTSALRRAGAQVALATDNMHGDMVETMRWALISGRLQEQAVTSAWQAGDVFHMATLGAAKSMGRAHDLGSLKVGKKADVVLIDFRKPHLTPAFNPVGTLIHLGQGRDVETVIVDGRIVVEHGKATLVDEEEIRRDGERAARQLWTRVTGHAPERIARAGAIA